MFKKTVNKLDEKYVEPIRNGIATAIVIAMMALAISVATLAYVLGSDR